MGSYKKNDPRYKAPYQDYNWCFDRYINKGMSHQEMADEIGVSKRVIQKWCVEKHHIHQDTYRDFKKLSDIQREIIIAGTLGDGHINKRIDQPMYIESHSMDEKDYLFWKYNYLKDLCKKPPKYYKESITNFSSDKLYKCKPFFRIHTRIINELKDIRDMNKLDKINSLTEFQFCLLMLDDGNRDSLWYLCVAEWSDEEIEALYNKTINDFTIRFNRKKDERYIYYDALSSKRIDELILKNIPNDLDIVKKKIINNNKIRPYRNSHYIITDNGKIGTRKYSDNSPIPYNILKKVLWQMDLPFNEITEEELLKIPEVAKYAI
jgi:LAGLIDADG DNA endonuclease family.